MMRFGLFMLMVFMIESCSGSREEIRTQEGERSNSQPTIQDNSFLIEEAYNQEAGVVQHISNLSYTATPQRTLSYVLTQEWPIGGQAHQFSYSIPYSSFEEIRIQGIGDVLLNYRYQLLGDGDWVHVAPRLSLVLPIGDESKGLGTGGIGLQLNLPASKEIASSIVVHANLGSTIFSRPKTLVSYFAGASVIWQVKGNFNIMLENLIVSNATTDDLGEMACETEVIVNPGVRFAMNFPNLQIVPGIGFPTVFKNGETSTGLFFYLSFEHPF